MEIMGSEETEAERLKECLAAALGSSDPVHQALVEAFAEFSPAWVDTKEDGQLEPKLPKPQEDRLTVELALRRLLLLLVGEAVAAGVPVMEWKGHENATHPLVHRLFDFILHAGDIKLFDIGIPITLLEDLVDMCSAQECEAIFHFLSARQALLQKPHIFDKAKLSFLRLCNSLLRRLSPSLHPALSGHILMFLAAIFPLSERSGVNPVGNYNTSVMHTLEEVQEGATDSNGQPVDVSFYKMFWGLQAVFCQPTTLRAKWSDTMSDIRAVIAEMRSQPVATPSTSGHLDGDQQLQYLPSSRLLRLQLRDADLRRQFLIQCLLLTHFAQQPQKDQDVLKPKQIEELKELEALVFDVLSELSDERGDLSEFVRHVLKRESQWVRWKREMCQPFERKPATKPPPPPGPPAKRARGMPQANKVVLGTPELDHLWNEIYDNSACLGAEDREHVPSLREFLSPVISQMEPDHEGPKLKEDAVYSWKAYRMLARESLAEFSKAAAKGSRGNLEEAVVNMFPDLVPDGFKEARQTAEAEAAPPPKSATTTPRKPMAPPRDVAAQGGQGQQQSVTTGQSRKASVAAEGGEKGGGDRGAATDAGGSKAHKTTENGSAPAASAALPPKHSKPADKAPRGDARAESKEPRGEDGRPKDARHRKDDKSRGAGYNRTHQSAPSKR